MTNETISISGLTQQLQQMAEHEAGLRKQLAEATDARRALATQLSEQLGYQQRGIEQMILRLDFEAGDEMIERVEGDDYKADVYRRKIAGPDYSSLFNMSASTKSAQDIVR